MKRIAFGALLVALAPSCKTPTEMSIAIQSDVGYRSDMTVAIAIDTPEAIETSAPKIVVRTPWSAGASLGDVVAVPSSDNDDLAVRVVLATGKDPSACTVADPAGCVVVRRRLRFTRGESTSARIVLRPACLGVVCDAKTSCAVDGSCGSLENDEGTGASPPPADVDAGGADIYAAAVIADRPRHYYRLDEPRGSTVAHDTMKRADGVIDAHVELEATGALETSANPGAFFDGGGSIVIDRAETSNGASTIEAWMRADSFDASRTIVERVDVVGDTSFGFRVSRPKDKSAAFAVFRGVQAAETSVAAMKNFAGYSHVVAVTRGASIEIYYDGIGPIASPLGETPATALVGPLVIGGSRIGNPAFHGAIDEVAIYDYPLDSSQVRRHYAASGAK